jgi:hypothetical protein
MKLIRLTMVAGAAVVLAIAALPASAYPRPGVTVRVSLSSSGGQENRCVIGAVAFTGIGSYLTGVADILDEIALSR